MQRRNFLGTGAAAAGLVILKSGVLRGQTAPSNRLNIALIGVWERGTAHYGVLAAEHIGALCDVNEKRLEEGVKIFPGAMTYVDWRRCLDQKDLDAVVICTADHHHAFICNWALNRNLHVFCEKPLGMSVEEVRLVRANYLKRKDRVATQHGTQRHAYPNFERIRELILDGAIGELRTVSAWDSRRNGRPGYPPADGNPPSFFHWDQWVGPSPMHPYSLQYFAASAPGNNCLAWNPYRDFGVGQIGDMGAHTMDLVWNCIDAGAPVAIEVDQEVSAKYDPNVCPVELKVTFEHPSNSWRGPITVVWYQGGLKPNPPKGYLDFSRVGNGVLFEGTKGFLFADFTSRVLIPDDYTGDLTYYKRRSSSELLPLVGGKGLPAPSRPAPGSAPARRGGGNSGRGGAAARGGQPPARTAPRNVMTDGAFARVELLEGGVPPALGVPNSVTAPVKPAPGGSNIFQQEWIDACKGLNNRRTHCDFDYSATMMEQMLLGLVAHRASKRLEYDPAPGRITNAPEANEWLRRTYRPGWNLNG
ncbi:MAG: Gfo/Idh/MocA family protein [Bryobacteraceae bacterium]